MEIHNYRARKFYPKSRHAKYTLTKRNMTEKGSMAMQRNEHSAGDELYTSTGRQYSQPRTCHCYLIAQNRICRGRHDSRRRRRWLSAVVPNRVSFVSWQRSTDVRSLQRLLHLHCRRRRRQQGRRS